MMVSGRSCGNILWLRPVRHFMLEASYASLAAFDLSHLLDKVPMVGAKVPSFGVTMLELTLYICEPTNFYEV